MAQVPDFVVRKLDNRHQMIINVRMSKEFRLRAWIATQLFRLAARVLGASVAGNEEIQE